MWRHLFSLLRKGKYVKKTMELTNDTPPEPSSHMVFTFTSAMSNPVTTCSNFQTPQRNERERERERVIVTIKTQQTMHATAEARNPDSCVTAGIARIPAPT
jgi:hypothetical protein